jgi:carboxyl-terminal processing protease
MQVRIQTLLWIFWAFLALLGFFLDGLWAQGSSNASEDHPKIFQYALYYILEGFIDEDKIDPQKMFESGLNQLELQSEDLFFEKEEENYQIRIGQESREFELLSPQSPRLLLILYLELVFDFIKEKYQGDRSLDELRITCLNGMLSTLDPHSKAFTKKEWEQFFLHMEGEIYGVGMYLEVQNGRLYGSNPVPGGPAYSAGIVHGDEILQINSESSVNMTAEQAVSKIRGPKGSTVLLTVRRKGEEEPRLFSITRDRIRIKNVEGVLLPSQIAYIELNSFSQETVKEFQKKLDSFGDPKNLKGLILDLRSNTGGLLDQAVEIADLFLMQGVLVGISDGKTVIKREEAVDQQREPRYPIAVLVSEHSASGAEVLAGALQKNDRAFLVGSQTFGKGSMQSPLELGDTGAFMKLTVGEYLIPQDISIQGVGLVPEIELHAIFLEGNLLNLFPDAPPWTEKEFELPLISKFNVVEHPFIILPYLKVPLTPEEFEFQRESFVRGTYDFSKDEEVLVAEKLLLRAKSQSPFQKKAFLEEQGAFLQEMKKEREEKIQLQLQAKGLDWSLGTASTPPTSPLLEAECNWKLETRVENALEYKNLSLTLTVKNKGTQGIYRLKGISESEFLRFHNLEFLFGCLEAGETQSRTLDIRLSKYSEGSQYLVKIALSTEKETLTSLEQRILLPDEPLPAFTFEIRLFVQEKQVFELQEGQEVYLNVSLTNTGEGKCSKGMAYLTHTFGDSIFLEKGRVELSELAPGASALASFQFRVKKIPQNSEGLFKISCYDLASEVLLTRAFAFPSQGEPDWIAGKKFQLPSLTLEILDLEEAHFTQKEKASLKVKVEVKGALLKKITIFHRYRPQQEKPYFQVQKIFFSYIRQRDFFEVEQELLLKTGTNEVIVLVEDEKGTQALKEYRLLKK